MTPSGTPESQSPSTDDEVIDVRDHVVDVPSRRPSGQPADLLPEHHLEMVTGGDRWVQVEAFVYDIYRRIGYCEASPRNRVEELARWDERSRFHAVIDEDDEVIGVVRTIFGTYDELPVGQFTRTDHRHPDPVCELSSLTVRSDVRSTGVIEHLYRAGWLDAFESGSRALVALIDEWLFDIFRDTYRLPFHVIGRSDAYMGSEPMPVGMDLVGSAYQVTAEQNPAFWAWTLDAITPEQAATWGLPLLDQPTAETSQSASAGEPSGT